MVYFVALNSEGVLKKALFSSYSNDVRPISYFYDPLEVELGYYLGKIEQLVSGTTWTYLFNSAWISNTVYSIIYAHGCSLFCRGYVFWFIVNYFDYFIRVPKDRFTNNEASILLSQIQWGNSEGYG